MTRINCIPVSELTNKHLVAEYRELPRVFRLARLPKPGEKFPTEYTMGTGHVKFFYDKLLWLLLRQHEIYDEMKRRNFNPLFDPEDLWLHHEQFNGDKPVHFWNKWTPTEKAMAINRARIVERLRK